MYDPESQEAILKRKIRGVKIRYARTRAGMNLKEVGEALSLSESLVADMEFGRRDATLPQVEVMALLFNVPVVFFLSEAPIEESRPEFPSEEALALRQKVIGVLLRQARTEAGQTQEELAQELGVSASFISSCELGKSDIPLLQLQTLAPLLNVSIDYFLDQGLTFESRNGHEPTLEELHQFAQLPKDVRDFLLNPANLLYLRIAISLSELSAETLRSLAEGLLEVTY